VLQATRGALSDQFVADTIAPTHRPGHLAEMAMDDDGKLLVCDSRADLIFQFDTRKRHETALCGISGHCRSAGRRARIRTRALEVS